MIKHLLTPLGKKVSSIPWQTYPRPQLKRNNWICLNGIWDFSVDNSKDIYNIYYNKKILVPFCVESLLSKINKCYKKKSVYHYQRFFKLEKDDTKKTLLHFGAVDQICDIYLNKRLVGHHEGGYLPFSIDISDYLISNNCLELFVYDDLDETFPHGKQKNNRGGMWYTKVSGIWQTVWIEKVPINYIKSLHITPTLNSVEIRINGIDNGIILLDGQEYPYKNGIINISIKNPILWSPENPHLYRFKIKAGNDEVESYFGLRTLQVKSINNIPRLCLNGKPYFFNGILDQGYYSDGIYTPASFASYTEDILKMKELGFNTLRKHIKIEPEFFYYECDRLGMIVFQDMVNNSSYSFLKDTILPNILKFSISDINRHKKYRSRIIFYNHMKETVNVLYNHPSICYWTIFNEAWGQFKADSLYEKLKQIDNTRFIDATSGWYHQTKSDVNSIHTYFKSFKVVSSSLPLVLSEFGGYSYKVLDHSANLKHTYAYKKFKTREEFVNNLRKLYLKEIVPAVSKGLCASIYTQLSDVEDETNGILTYDRAVSKIKKEEFIDIARLIREQITKES